MRFYEACIAVVRDVQSQMSLEEQLCFMDASYEEMWKYHFTIGTEIRNRYLKDSSYLYRALLALGKTTPDEMSAFLMEFMQHYLRLERAEML